MLSRGANRVKKRCIGQIMENMGAHRWKRGPWAVPFGALRGKVRGMRFCSAYRHGEDRVETGMSQGI